jgi:hypothetical protein
MSGQASHAQWYLARDGQQFGPISEPEMAKLVELGHLQATDLLWREGFPDWRPAMVVFPPRGPGAGSGPRLTRPDAGRQQAGPQHTGSQRSSANGFAGYQTPTASLDEARGIGRTEVDAYRAAEPRRRGGVLMLLLLLLLLVGGAGAAGYVYREELTGLAASFTVASGAMSIGDRKSLETPPLIGFRAGTMEAIDAGLQNTALWRVLKREFPDWYSKRIEEAANLARENKDDAVIGQYVARKLVELRRQQVANGLSARLPMLKTVASAYLDTLGKLRAQSPEACGGFVRQGEAEPLIVGYLQGSQQTAHLQSLLTAVFEAIADGRQVPRVHPQPNQAQYAMLAAELGKRGWTQADFRTVSSRQAMAQAEPAKACQLMHDFFGAQFAIPDQEVQMRLLAASLNSVFGG